MVMLIMTIRMTAHQIVRVKRNIPIEVVLLVQFLQMVYSCSLAYDFATEIANTAVSGNHIKSRLLPQFRLV